MDKTIVVAGGTIVALGVSFTVAGGLDNNLHAAYGLGGAFWTVVGAVTIGLGLKVKRSQKQEKPIRTGAI